MRVLSFLALGIFISTFVIIYFTNFQDTLIIDPPFYHDQNNFYLTELVALFFSFFCSVLFFGASGPVVSIIQASRYASILLQSQGTLDGITTAMFALPNLFVIIAGTEYGSKFLDQMKGNEKTLSGRTELVLGILLFIIAILLRMVISN